MAAVPQSRISYTSISPFRTKRPATDKLIFLSCEGCVTEEEYFATTVYQLINKIIELLPGAE